MRWTTSYTALKIAGTISRGCNSANGQHEYYQSAAKGQHDPKSKGSDSIPPNWDVYIQIVRKSDVRMCLQVADFLSFCFPLLSVSKLQRLHIKRRESYKIPCCVYNPIPALHRSWTQCYFDWYQIKASGLIREWANVWKRHKSLHTNIFSLE